MDRLEFEQCIEMLKKNFSDKQYTKERIEGFWASFRNLESGTLTRAVKRACEHERQYPLIDDLREYVEKAKPHVAPGQHLEKGCHKCRERGFHLMFNDDGNCAAFRCDCELGRTFANSPQLHQAKVVGYVKPERRSNV